MTEKRLAYLFGAYFNKTATSSETDELMELLERSAYDEHLRALLAATWASFEPKRDRSAWKAPHATLPDIFQKEAATGSKRRRPFRGIAVPAAAVVIVLVTAISYWLVSGYANKQQSTKTFSARAVHDTIVPGSSKAMLTLSDGSTVSLDSLHAGPLARQGNTRLLNLSTSTLAYKAPEADTAETVFNTLSTNNGGQYQLLLSDGTRVWLNASSSIKYPVSFTGEARRVTLTGEAYFEVAKNASMPFIVATIRSEVQVLGTRFNIMSYADERTVNTTLLEGAVKVKASSVERTLRPGQESRTGSQADIKVVEADVEEVLAWKNGWFQFIAADIEKIMRQIARWYNVGVVYDGKIPAGHFTGMVSRNNDIAGVLQIMQSAGVQFSIKGRTVTVRR